MNAAFPHWHGVHVDGWVDLSQTHPVDPYALWALDTGFRSLKTNGRMSAVLNFIVELDAPGPVPADLFSALPLPPGRISIPPPYRQPLATGYWPRFITVRLDILNVDPHEVERQVQSLIQLSRVKRIQIGQQLGCGNPDLPPSTDKGLNQPPDSSQPQPLHRSGDLVLGILEDACPFAHAALRDLRQPAQTRVVALWDQSTLRGAPHGDWRHPGLFPYGLQMTPPTMQAAMARHTEGGRVDEAACYADPAVDMKPLAQRASHGAAVLGLMAGLPQALPTKPRTVSPEGSEPPPILDAAAQVPLVCVQLPTEQTQVSSGRWLAVNALDGLRYIMHTARHLKGGQVPKLVVNVSYGAIAGPHDGTGMLESAMDELCQHAGHDMAVVLAAGNTHGTRRPLPSEAPADTVTGPYELQARMPSGVHAQAILKPGHSTRLSLFIPPDKQFETYVEIWFKAQGDAAPPSDAGLADVAITLTPPHAIPLPVATCPSITPYPAPPQPPQAALYFLQRVPQGSQGAMALLVVAATQISSSSRVYAPSGLWQIDILHHGKASPHEPLRVQAWVERDDTRVGVRRPQSARFVPLADGAQVNDHNTFSNIASGNQTFRAGALRNRGYAARAPVSDYSAQGPQASRGPEFSAFADDGEALDGVRVVGSQSGMLLRVNGTSMAAPQAARWLANQLEAGQTLTGIRTYLATLPADERRGRLRV